MEKYNELLENLKKYDKMCIAYSGGADSTLLLKAAMEVLGDNVFAVIADTIVFSRKELAEALETAKTLGAKCYTTDINVLEVPQLAYNEANRCYHCKKIIFSGISKIAYLYGTKVVADGKIYDDSLVYRPGATAALEMGIVSPLADCGFTKADVRRISKQLGLPTWDKPSNACLTTRFPYDTEITKEKLSMIEKGENFLMSLGLKVVRLRTHENVARIEMNKADFPLFMNDEDAIQTIKDLGYKYVTIDLEGFRSGSMDD